MRSWTVNKVGTRGLSSPFPLPEKDYSYDRASLSLSLPLSQHAWHDKKDRIEQKSQIVSLISTMKCGRAKSSPLTLCLTHSYCACYISNHMLISSPLQTRTQTQKHVHTHTKTLLDAYWLDVL